MTEESHAEQTAEQHAAAAQDALEAADLTHAAHHVVLAIATDPCRQEWVAILDEICGRAADPLALFPNEGTTFHGVAAARARALLLLGRLTEGCALLLEVADY